MEQIQGAARKGQLTPRKGAINAQGLVSVKGLKEVLTAAHMVLKLGVLCMVLGLLDGFKRRYKLGHRRLGWIEIVTIVTMLVTLYPQSFRQLPAELRKP